MIDKILNNRKIIFFIFIISFIILLVVFYVFKDSIYSINSNINSVADSNTNKQPNNAIETYLSPKGDNLVVLKKKSHYFSLEIINLATNEKHLIQLFGINESIHSIIWDKDGNRFYYATTRKNPEIYTTLSFVDLTYPDPFASSEIIFEYGDLIGEGLKIIGIQDESLILQADYKIYLLPKNSGPGTKLQLINDLSEVLNR